MVSIRLVMIYRVPNLAQVSFDSSSQGQLAMVIYEWADAPYLGKITSEEDDYLPVSTNHLPIRSIEFSSALA